jgi:hypothetical protein
MKILLLASTLMVGQYMFAGDEAMFDAYVMREAHHSGVTVSQVFRLWNVESGRMLDDTPNGKRGEIGRAQIMLSTARDYDRTVTARRLHGKWVNTRVLFQHLRSLRQQLRDAGVPNSLLPLFIFSAYNRGIAKVLKDWKRNHRGWNAYGKQVAGVQS